MSDRWTFYFDEQAERPASIYVDIGIVSTVPLAEYGHFACLHLKLRYPSADGLSLRQEFDDLMALEDRVIPELEAGGGMVHVGRRTGDGYRDFHLFVTDPDAFEPRVGAAMRSFPDYAFQTSVRADPQWRVYLDTLYPSPEDFQRIGNREVLASLERAGDDHDEVRPIDHAAKFSDAASLASFRVDVERLGFAVTSQSTDEDGALWLDFTRDDRPSEINEVALPLYRAALALGGQYDGWGCEVRDGSPARAIN